MATVTFQMASTPLTGSKAFTGSDADMQALLDWAAVAYADVIQQLFNPSGTLGFTPTNAQIGVALATGTVNAWKGAVKRFKDDQARAALTPSSSMTWA